MLLYAISRFIIEIYRGDSRGIINFIGNPLSTSQFVSVLLVPLSLVMLVYLGRTSGPSPAETASRRARAA
jgi:prolipoprotein diacylglyceryltransferase